MIIWIMDQKDLKQIGEIVRAEVIKNNFMLIDLMDVKLKNLKNEISKDFEVKMLKWKSEIVDAVDAMAKEIRDEREFREISSHQTIGNIRRIEKLETKVFGSFERLRISFLVIFLIVRKVLSRGVGTSGEAENVNF